MDDAEYEEHATFVGCTCEHDTDEHGWGSCNVEGCLCEGGWEEGPSVLSQQR
jgi:hypothetical protein